MGWPDRSARRIFIEHGRFQGEVAIRVISERLGAAVVLPSL